jgi:hypothetical protein
MAAMAERVQGLGYCLFFTLGCGYATIRAVLERAWADVLVLAIVSLVFGALAYHLWPSRRKWGGH